jgi:hypothetical protein
MCRFVPYIRTAEGHTERISFAIYNSPYDTLYPYIFAERLVGWPERKVFWAAESGPCVGVAPVSSYKLVKAQRSPGLVSAIFTSYSCKSQTSSKNST